MNVQANGQWGKLDHGARRTSFIVRTTYSSLHFVGLTRPEETDGMGKRAAHYGHDSSKSSLGLRRP